MENSYAAGVDCCRFISPLGVNVFRLFGHAYAIRLAHFYNYMFSQGANPIILGESTNHEAANYEVVSSHLFFPLSLG